MPVNSLATEASLRVGPVVLETLIKHYFDRIKKTATDGKPITPLRQDELMYDEVFNVVKTFLHASSFHTVEDVQGFANTRTPSPPWVHVVRLVVPMSSCDEAAKYLIKAFGGEESARRVVGGAKWWQVRGLNGIDAQWITAKKDWREAKRRHKMHQKAKETIGVPLSDEKVFDSGVYEKDMDELRCILYSHGGGYYFGSVDQERYSIQRYARKINGRVFAVNYRLAPQYPFPCALQDLLAAYLFLIRPPPGAAHRAVNPLHIVVAGDSAGGGISLALLQVIRDSGLPMPAGGVLISPWCDLTHSFPSVHTNTATDVIPDWGLSLQKPSVLWPPPSEELSNQVHASLKARIRQAFQMDPYNSTASMLSECQASASAGHAVDAGPTTPFPASDTVGDQTVSLVARSGEVLSTTHQLHLYTQNSLLPHPLISSALSYLGGLPPLLIIASDKEVLRDEIIYTAHKAAYPDRFPIKDETRALYPSLDGIEDRYKPTKVHLQVYDDTAHVLPVLFSFTTPAKFCFRAIAAFCKHVTGLAPTPSSPTNTSSPTLSPRSSFLGANSRFKRTCATSGHPPADKDSVHPQPAPTPSPSDAPRRKSLRRSFSASIHRATSGIRHRPVSRAKSEYGVGPPDGSTIPKPPPLPHREDSTTSSDVGGPRFQSEPPTPQEPEAHFAGSPGTYGDLSGKLWDGAMIRERVSTQGVIRPLEPESELVAFDVHPDCIGRMSELTLRRYLDARAMFDKKFAHSIHLVEKQRHRHLRRAKEDTQRNMTVLQHSLMQEDQNDNADVDTSHGIKAGLLASSGSWSWAWALEGDERPPPSSIVSRRDTAEARRLARIADQAVFQGDQSLSGNRFWSAVVNFLTVTPDRDRVSQDSPIPSKGASRLPRFLRRESYTLEGHPDSTAAHVAAADD
ncbi:AB hydrolase superfamily protein C4A8.06c [Hypsizygus marmoreus]|uniref:AB hydrolase superfamily protein C4A8.06c n=1 Tax=Hypsizygus marmoreus TaxID=39966 RepID=A0A369JQZ8_HYPMA|nr:AB hydrolase superfamily protein C4A8.06c [Hypsizygus marmoreus]